MKTPTDEEIKSAYDAMYVEIHDPGLAASMGEVAATNPMLRWQIKKLAEGYAASRNSLRRKLGDKGFFEASLASAVMYGVTLGIYIGMARQQDRIQ